MDSVQETRSPFIRSRPVSTPSPDQYLTRQQQLLQLPLPHLAELALTFEKMLGSARRQNSLHAQQHSQQLQEVLREMSVTEAECLRVRENCQAAQATAGQALDQCAKLQEQLSATTRKASRTQQLVQLEQQIAKRAAAQERERMLEGQKQQIEAENIQLRKQVQHLKAKYEEISQRIASIEQQLQEGEEFEKSEQVEHHGTYWAGSQSSLGAIVEEEGDESSGDWGRPKTPGFPTSTSLHAQEAELELMKQLCKNVQADYDQLLKINEGEKEALKAKEMECEELKSKMQMMKFEFMGEVSRVTALVSQRLLGKNVQRIEQGQEGNHDVNGAILEEKDLLLWHCAYLEEENSRLVKLCQERQDLLDQVMALIGSKRKQIEVVQMSVQTDALYDSVTTNCHMDVESSQASTLLLESVTHLPAPNLDLNSVTARLTQLIEERSWGRQALSMKEHSREEWKIKKDSAVRMLKEVKRDLMRVLGGEGSRQLLMRLLRVEECLCESCD